MLPLLFIDLFLNLHVALDSPHYRIEGSIGYQPIILDDVAAAQCRLSEQIRPNLQAIAGAGLNHVVEQGAFLYSQDFSYSFDAPFRSLEAVHVLLREAYVHQLDIAAHGDIANYGGQQHRYLLADVDLGVSYLHKPLPGLQIEGHSKLIVRHLIHPDYLGNVLAANIHGFAGHWHPRACALLHRQHGGSHGDGKRCRIGHQICADDIVIIVHTIRQSQWETKNFLHVHLEHLLNARAHAQQLSIRTITSVESLLVKLSIETPQVAVNLLIAVKKRIVNLRIPRLWFIDTINFDDVPQRFKIRIYAHSHRRHQRRSNRSRLLRFTDSLHLFLSYIGQNLPPGFALGPTAYHSEKRERKLDLLLHDFHNPPDIITNAFIDCPQHVFSSKI